jgi:diguanylate cyclase (GGDEF)-like protein
VRKLLSSGRSVVVMVASEYVAALYPLTPDEVETRVTALGFSALETTVLGEELVATTYDQWHSRSGSYLPQLRSTCPVVVDWIRKFHPQLTEALAPIVPPYVAHARLMRELYPEGTAIVYVSPCWSRKDEIFQADIAGDIDVAIGFDELKRLLDEAPESLDGDQTPQGRPRAIKQLSGTDGFPRRILAEHSLIDGEVAVARGFDEVERLLTAIIRGETAPSVVDMLTCEGCIDGPAVNRDLSVFVKRAIDSGERRSQAPAVIDSQTLLAALPSVPLNRRFRPQPVSVATPTEKELQEVLALGEFEGEEDFLDCGACGYRTCLDHAVAVWADMSSWEVCFPLQKRRLIREREQFAKAAVSDGLTGLMNRREFDRRLAEEIARASRYSTPLSLVMMDIDRFKDINDTRGHASGDAVLRAVGVLLRSELRAADAAARFGGDEFALILPNTAKTDAWAVAEKLRSSFEILTVTVDDDESISATVSLGVASLSERVCHPVDLLEAADRALYKAKRTGRDRVELAPG